MKAELDAHAAAGRQVAVVVDLDAALDAEVAQDLADGGMGDLVDGLAVLHLGVDHAILVLEERRQIAAGDVAVLVDGGREDGAAVLPIPGRIVGAAAEEGDAKWGSADDHFSTLLDLCRTAPAEQ